MHMLQCTKMGWKIIYVSLGSCLGPMQEMGMNFKHLGVVDRPQTLRNLVFNFLQIQNSSEIHETWHGVMKWHQHVVVIFLSNLEQVSVQASCKPELLSRSLVVPMGNVSPLWTKWHSLPLLALNIFPEATWINRTIVLKFEIIQGLFGHFYTLTKFLGILCA